MVSSRHLVTVAVALGTLATTLPDGAYSTQARSVLAVAVWWAVVGGLLLRVLPMAPAPGEAIAAGACLVALAGFTALSIGWASDNGGAFDEALRATGYAGVFTLVVLASPSGSARSWLVGLTIGLVAVGVLGVGSRMIPSLFGEQDLARALPETRGRLSYPLGYWNAMGATLALATVLLVAVAGFARSIAGRSLATAAIPVTSLGLFLTSSRGGALAGGVGLVVLFAISPKRLRLAAAMLVGGAGAAVLILAAASRDLFTDGRTAAPGYGAEADALLLLSVVVVGAVLTIRPLVDSLVERIRVPRPLSLAAASAVALALAVGVVVADPAERWDELKAPPDTEAQVEGRGLVTRHLASTEGTGRYQYWQAGWDAFKSEPLIGIGAAGYEPWWAQNGSLDYYVRNAHSLFVETGAELGLVGLALLFGFLGTVVGAGVRRRKAGGEEAPLPAAGLAALACGATAAAVEWTWEIPGAFAPVVVVAAVLAGPALWVGPAPPRAFGRLLAAGVLVVGLAGLVVGGIALTSDAKLRASRGAAEDGDLVKAADDASSAAAIQPWAAAPRLQLALVREESDPDGALQAAAEAVERAPEDWRNWLVITRLRANSGDREGALRALRRTRALAPPSAALRNLLGSGSPN